MIDLKDIDIKDIDILISDFDDVTGYVVSNCPLYDLDDDKEEDEESNSPYHNFDKDRMILYKIRDVIKNEQENKK